MVYGDVMPLAADVSGFVDRAWDDIVPLLHDYIAIPAVSEAYDPAWREHGHIHRAVDLVAEWCRSRSIAGMTVEVIDPPDLSPLVVVEIPTFGDAPTDDTVLLYGHLDKQPEMEGWRDGLGPWTPVVEGDKLYGRGGADDGYAAFASLTAIEAVQAAGFDMHIHIDGDGSARVVLDAYERVLERRGHEGRRHVLAHNSMADPADANVS